MAEVVACRNNALPVPCWGLSWTFSAPLLDADGDPISPSSPDSEVSKNCDTFADCTNEFVEIATASGIGYLTLTATEMQADIVTAQVKSTGAKTTVMSFYTKKLVALTTGTCQGSNDTGDIQLASGEPAIDDFFNGLLCVAVIDGTTEHRIVNDYVGSTKVAEIAPAWNTAQPDNNDTYTIYLTDSRQFSSADMKAWNGTAVKTPTTAGVPEVCLTDAVSHGGTLGSSTATLALSRFSTVSQSSNTAAWTVTGNGSGDAALLTGGATGNALELVGGGTSGDSLKTTTTSGHGFNITASGTAKDAFHLTGAAAATTNAGGHGINATGGAATDSSGGTPGIGIRSRGGAGSATLNTPGIGCYVLAGADGGAGGNSGMEIDGTTAGAGLEIHGGSSGAAVLIAGGGTSGNGVTITTTSGHGVSIAATGASKHGVTITGGNSGTCDAVTLIAGTGGVGLRAGSVTVTGVTTLTGAVSLGSTLGVTGTTTLAAINTGAIGTGNVTITGTLSTSGTCTLNALTVTNATTLSGAVSLGSTLGVTGTTTLAAVNTGAIGTGNVTITGTLSTSGTCTLNAFTVTNAFTVSGATTLTGTVTATGGSNDIRGIQVNGMTAVALKDFFDTDSTTTFGSAVAGSVVKEIADNAGGSALTTDAIAEAMFTYNATADYSTADAGSVVKQIATNAGGGGLTQADVRTAVGMASANLDTQLSGINSKTTNLPSDPADASDIASAFSTVNSTLSTIAGYIDTEVATILSNLNSLITTVGVAGAGLTAADDAVIAAIAALNNISTTQVNAEMVDALNVDTYAEPGQGNPAATTTITAKLGYLYKAWRNKKDQDAATTRLYADNGTTVDQKASTTDTGTLFTTDEIVTGP